MIRLSAGANMNAATDVVVDTSTGAPTIVHWGASLGVDVDLDTVLPALSRPIVHGTFDEIAPISVVPEHGSGWTGRPGLLGRRGGGKAWAPRFSNPTHTLDGN